MIFLSSSVGTVCYLDQEPKSDRVKGEKYCKFHNDHGHITEHCRAFYAYIERLIRDGELGNYAKGSRNHNKWQIDKNDNCSPSLVDRTESENNPRKTINVIFGGDSMGQNKGYTRKVMLSRYEPQIHGKRARKGKLINFSDVNINHVMQPHDDPLVIQTDIDLDFHDKRMIIGREALLMSSKCILFSVWDLPRKSISLSLIYRFTNATNEA